MTAPRRYGLRSLRFKLVLASVVVETLMLTVLIWNSTRITGDALVDTFQDRIDSLVPLLSVSLAGPLAQRDYATLDERLGSIVRHDSLAYIEVRDELGNIAASRGEAPHTAQLDTSFKATDNIYDQMFDITLAGEVIGRARYGLNTSRLQATLVSLRNQGALVASAEIVLTILLLATLGALLTRHLQVLAQAARALADGDYAVRVPAAGRDEVADTAQAFNIMAETLAHDLIERRQAEAALQESEARLRLALDAAHMGTFDWDVPHNRITWSRWHEDLWGFQPGEFGGTYEAFSQRLHPDDLPRIDAEVARCIAAREPFVREFRVVWPDGSTHWIASHGEFTFDADGQPLRMLGAVREITARKQAEALLSGEKKVLGMIAAGAPLSEILETITYHVETVTRDTLCSILLLDNDGVHLLRGAAPSLPEDYNRAIHGMAIGPQAGSCGTAVYRNQPVIVADIATDPLWDDYRALALPHGLRACWSMPIRSADGQVLGSFALYYRVPRAPGPADFDLIARVTHLSAIAIERRRDEATLKQSEQRLRDLIDGMGPQMFVGLLTLDGVVVEANRSALAVAGLKPEDVLGRPFEETYWWSYSEEKKQQLREAVARAAQGEASRYDVQIRVAENQFIVIDFSIQPLRDETGKVVFLVPSAMVITERKHAEEALIEKQRVLSESQQIAHIGSWTWDLATQEISWSEEMYRLYGVSPTDFALNPDSNLNLVHPDDRPAMLAWLADCTAGKHPQDLEFRVVQPKGEIRVLNGRSVLECDANIRPLRLLGTAQDITENKKAQQVLRASEKLEEQYRLVHEANRLKSEFLANMSHELRTPLNAIIGFSELMHDGKVGAVAPDHKEYLGDILTSAKHLLQLINDVLDLAKVESGTMMFFPEPVNLTTIIGEVRNVLRALMLFKHIEVAIEVDAALGEVVADASKLKQVLYNYLSNALKFSPEGGRVTVRALLEGDMHYRIEVEDSGIGIKRADLARLFVEFQQLDTSTAKKYQGTGLGLALTKRVVEAQYGRVGVTSDVGKGSVFYAVLPRMPLPAPPSAQILVVGAGKNITRA